MFNVNRWAMVENGIVINIVNWDGDLSKWMPPAGIQMVLASDEAGIGWTYQDGQFEKPIDPPPTEE